MSKKINLALSEEELSIIFTCLDIGKNVIAEKKLGKDNYGKVIKLMMKLVDIDMSFMFYKSLEPPFGRIKVRHSFDIYQDQLTTLQGIQLTDFKALNKKIPFGNYIQEALDDFTKKRTKKR